MHRVSAQSHPLRAAAFAAVLLAAASSVVCGPGCRSGGRKPNVLLIVMDTTRGDRVSVNGYPRKTTPALERLAAEGAAFVEAWSPSCWTGPAHAALFTGLGADRHGYSDSARPFLDERMVTLTEALRAAGWATGGFSNNPWVSSEQGFHQGFDRYDDVWRDRPEYPQARETFRRVLEWTAAREAAGDPWFAFVNLMEPHAPYTPDEATAARFVRAPEAGSEQAAGHPLDMKWARNFQFPETLGYQLGTVVVPSHRMELCSDLYDAEIAVADAEIGALADALRARGALDGTIVVVTGDHGEEFGEHRLAEHGFGLWRTLLHVPLVIRMPGRFDGGRRDPGVARLEDVAPTILGACGVAAPAGPDGAALDGADLGAVAPKAQAPRAARAAFGPVNRHEFQARKMYPGCDTSIMHRRWRSVFDGKLHLLVRDDGDVRLFDTAADPLEQKDLAPARAADVERLRALLPR